MTKNKTKEQVLKLIGLFILAAIISVSLYFIKAEQYKNWLPEKGILTNIENYSARRSRHDTRRSYCLFYSYMVDGKIYDGSSSYSGKAPDNHFIGEQVDVWYNPEEPSQSSYHKPGPGLYPYLPFIFYLPISLIVLKSTSLRRQI